MIPKTPSFLGVFCKLKHPPPKAGDVPISLLFPYQDSIACFLRFKIPLGEYLRDLRIKETAAEDIDESAVTLLIIEVDSYRGGLDKLEGGIAFE